MLNGATPFGSICIQLAHHWGATVITTCSTSDEKLYLQMLTDKLCKFIGFKCNQYNSQWVGGIDAVFFTRSL